MSNTAVDVYTHIRDGLLIYDIYIGLNPDAQSALQHFKGDFARLLIWAQIAATQFTILLERAVGYTGARRTE